MQKENTIMSFDINKWKKFLLTESQQPELLEEALEDRVPVSVAEEIREDISTLPWVMAGAATGDSYPQDVKGVENLLADWFVQEHDPGDDEESSAKRVIQVIVWNWKRMAGPSPKVPHYYPIPSNHMAGRTFEILDLLEYRKYPNITLYQAYLEMQKFVLLGDYGFGRNRELAWEGVKDTYMGDPNASTELWVDRPTPKAVLTTPIDNFKTMAKPAVFRIEKSFKKYKAPTTSDFYDRFHGKDFPLDIDFRTDHPTFQDIIDYLEPVDNQLDAITDDEEKGDYWYEANMLIMRSFGRIVAKEMKLVYNYLRPATERGLSRPSLEKIQGVYDNTEKYFDNKSPVSYKILNGVYKTLKKIITKDQETDSETIDKMLVKLQSHFLTSYKNMYKRLIGSKASVGIREFLGLKASNWRQLKGKSLPDARKYANAAVNNFESADQVRIKYPDGSYWYEIGVAGCEDEDNEWRDKELKKAAQRHANCAADGGGSLWTLRYKDSEGNIESEIMVSYFKERNKLGQIKGSPPNAKEGQGNQAPNKKWWKHILDLVNKLKIVQIDERGQYTSSDQMEKFPPFLLWIQENADHDVHVEVRPRKQQQPDQWGDGDVVVGNPWEPGGEVPFQERLMKNLNLKPKKKLSKNAQAILEWYKWRRKR